MSIAQRLPWLALIVAFVLRGCCFAGDIIGTVSAPKLDRVVVYVEGVKGSFSAQDAMVDQQSKVFVPYVVPVVRGAKITFRNDDNLPHNVFGIGPDQFNLGTFNKGTAREHIFNKEGDVTLLCNVHPEMEGHVLVLDNPYFARPDASGKFDIPSVPAGDYLVKAWYAGKMKKQAVKVPASGSVSVTF